MAQVRIFTFPGLVSAPVVSGSRLSTDSVQMLKWPYLGGELLTPDTVTPVTSLAGTASAATQVAYVQVQPGKTVTYEVSTGNGAVRLATASSPTLIGDAMIQFGPGWQLSVLEITVT